MMNIISIVLNTISIYLLPYCNNHLEGVDSEWILDEITVRSSISIITIISALILSLFLGLIWLPLICIIPMIISLLILPYILGRLSIYYFNQLTLSTRRLFVALKARQAAAFSLRMDPSRSSESIRRSFLLLLRQSAHTISNASSSIAIHDPDESGRLLLSFSTQEMNTLLYDDISPQISSLSSLKTIWELVILLESESIRLILLFLPSHPIVITKALINIIIGLRSVSNDLNEIHRRLHSMSFVNKIPEKGEIIKVDESTLVLQLEMIIECLRSSTLNVDGAMKTLHTIVLSHSFTHLPSNSPLIPNSSISNQEDSSIDQSTIPLISIENPIPRDELFESYGERKENEKIVNEESSYCGMDIEPGEILCELKVAIEDRAEMTKERERRIRIERGDLNEEEEELNKKEDIVMEKIEMISIDERSGDLHSQINNIIRRRKGINECIIGNDSSDSD